MRYRRIRNLREDHDLAQTQTGIILSCSQRVYSNYERGDNDIPAAILIRLADFYGVSADGTPVFGVPFSDNSAPSAYTFVVKKIFTIQLLTFEGEGCIMCLALREYEC